MKPRYHVGCGYYKSWAQQYTEEQQSSSKSYDYSDKNSDFQMVSMVAFIVSLQNDIYF